MKKSMQLASMVALAAMLAACHRGGDISFDGHSVSLHASGQPTATITARGDFSVGPKAVDLAPDQRQLFLRYYNRVTAVHANVQALKHAGWDLTGQALHMAGQSIARALGGAASAAGNDQAATQAMDAKGKQLQAQVSQLCQDVHQAATLQATLAAQIPAFKPYAGVDPAPGVNCGQAITVD